MTKKTLADLIPGEPKSRVRDHVAAVCVMILMGFAYAGAAAESRELGIGFVSLLIAYLCVYFGHARRAEG